MITTQNKQDITKILRNHFYDLTDNSITDIKRLTGGTDTEIIFFNLKYKNHLIPFIIKLFRNRIPSSRSKTEYERLSQVFNSNIKVPKTFGFLDNTCSFSRPFMVMEFIQGKVLSEVLYSTLNTRSNLYSKFVNNMISIHSIDWKVAFNNMNTPDIITDPFCISKSIIARSENLIQKFSIHEFEPIIQWLKNNMSSYPCSELVLCHGDYHPKNILVTANDELVTIDWSNVGPGDRRADLAFTIVMMSAETDSNVEKLVLDSYEQQTGVKIFGIEYFKVLTNVFNFIRMYSAAVDYSITQETDDTKKVLLTEYKAYCETVHSLMKNKINISFPTIEKFLFQG